MLAAQLSKCRFCFENPEIAKHLIIAIGLKVGWNTHGYSTEAFGGQLLTLFQGYFEFLIRKENRETSSFSLAAIVCPGSRSEQTIKNRAGDERGLVEKNPARRPPAFSGDRPHWPRA